MKKFALAVLVTLIAASPAAAQDTKKKAKKTSAPAAAASTDQNQNAANFAKDALPIFLPSWSMPAYMAVSKRKE